VWQFAGMDNAGHALAPQQVPGATGAVALAGQGDGTAYALMPDGTVLAWGAGSYGQLGNGGDCSTGNCPSSATPVQVSGLTGVTALADNHDTGYALKSDGTVWAWGDASRGALGDGAWIGHNSSVPVQIAGLSGVTAIGNGGVAVTNVP
jgi:alpha-tubulin suppressor-like RCC1 family protein